MSVWTDDGQNCRRNEAAFIGSSGVGKSTLINRLLGEECLKTNTLRKDDKGRHTTTHRELFLLKWFCEENAVW